MCVTCHGAPGVLPSEIGVGLSPPAPDLSHIDDLNSAEIYWIIRHGIDMTGMPAFSRTHDDASLWAMTAFVQRLSQVSPLQYDSLRHVFQAEAPPTENQSENHPH